MYAQYVRGFMIQQSAILIAASLQEQHSRISQRIGYALYVE